MRYLIITYMKKATGEIDEVLSVSKKVKFSDLQTANIIMDFKLNKVEKCIIDKQQVDTDWDRLHTYYSEHYPAIIQRLEVEAK